MPTPSHETVIKKYLADGYRKQGFAEFLRLTHYLTDALGTDADSVLLEAYRLSVEKGMSVALKYTGRVMRDNGRGYRSLRKEYRAPSRVPDAWAIKESIDMPGRVEVHVIEVTHFYPPDMNKLGEYGLASDQLDRCFLRVTEANARTGEICEHDPLAAWIIMMRKPFRGIDRNDPLMREAEVKYADFMKRNERLVG